jgi:hypothetical protein
MTAVIHSKNVSVVLSNNVKTAKARKALASQVIEANPGFLFNINETLPPPATGCPFDIPVMRELRNAIG